MTSRERILAVIEGDVPDRVPVTLFIHDEGHFLQQVFPETDIKNHQENKRKVIDLQRNLGTDIHLRLWGGCFPLWLVTGGVNTDEETDSWKVRKKILRENPDHVVSSEIITPDGILTQTYSKLKVNPGTYHYACIKKPVKSIKDLELIFSYEPQMEEGFPERLKSVISDAKQYLGNDGVISLWLPGGVFNHASRLVEAQELYALYLTDEYFYKKLMDTVYNRLLPYLQAALQTEADIINIGGNVAGGFIGKNNFDKYILPYEIRLIDMIRKSGKSALYHNCGNIMNLTDSYASLGADIVESFSVHPLGDGDLRQVKRITGGRYTVIGNIDQVNIIQKGTPADIEKVVKETLDVGKPGGRFILQPSDFLEYGTPYRNVEAYVQAGFKYGRYL